MEERITELELRFMHQEKIINDLNETVCRQELAIAHMQVEAALELGQRGRIADILTNGYITLARLHLAQSNGPAALEAVVSV